MKRFITILIIFVFVGGFVGLKISRTKSTDSINKVQKVGDVSIADDKEQTKNPNEVYVIPRSLSIPKINVDASVESVGLDPKRAMDVPKDPDNVGWYNLGVKPGEKGNAVMDGHLDKASGAPAVFWNITKLISGDKLIVTDENGKDLTFAVTKIEKYPYDNFPLQKVFGPSDRRLLNLISCNGVWNSNTHNYSQRTVVYSELVP